MENFHESQASKHNSHPNEVNWLDILQKYIELILSKSAIQVQQVDTTPFPSSFLALLDDLNSPPLRGTKAIVCSERLPFCLKCMC